ncbi:MAG: hypothetical protein RLY86_3397 [Pseudomonadota bacterium]|jgi:hypothetical protein
MSVCDDRSGGFRRAPGSPPGRRALAGLLAWLGLALTLTLTIGTPAGARADDPVAEANRQFVAAMQAIRTADRAYDTQTQAEKLLEAERLLTDIVTRLPESPLAVQLITNQFIGDFDYVSFKARVRGLACAEAESAACILHRISGLMSPLEDPVVAPRWDWLSLAVAHYRVGSKEPVKPIIAPFLEALRRGTARSAGGTGTSQDLFVSRALALTGEMDRALEITRGIEDCATRIYNLTDIAEVMVWSGDAQKATVLAEEAADYARTHACAWELGLVAQGLLKVGAEDRARTLFLNTVEEQFSRFKDQRGTCCPPELAVAAGDLGDANLALGLLRTVQEDSPWTVPQVLGKLAARGEFILTGAYADQIADLELRAETYAELVAGALAAGNRGEAEGFSARINAMLSRNPRDPLVLIHRARADRMLHKDDRWRRPFLEALTEAEAGNASAQRRDVSVPLLAALVEIETGKPLLQ